jgi:DNA repair protein RecO (recombination protein O)
MQENITAFLIHTRDYQNTSKLLDFLTDDFGLIRLVAKGVKNSKNKVQPFLKMQITLAGKGELKSLKNWEIIDNPRFLQGEKLMLMMYINELISKLAPSDNLNLCKDYLYLLENLSEDKDNNLWQLRMFENEFLEQLGYGIDFENDSFGEQITENNNYNFILNQGFIIAKVGVSGAEILRIAKKIMPIDNGLYFCKKINRERINFLLKGRELKTRKLFSVKS